jgi:hypothetical protein
VIRARLLAAIAVMALSGCGTSLRSPSASPSSPGVALPDPGRPYDADALLEAMRDSRRPGGVPMELQDSEIAAALAGQLWTFDGAPWPAIAAGASCGASTCTLELSGGGDDSGGEDAWVFTVDPASASVEVLSADLHAVPDETAAALDRLARAADAEGALDGLVYTAVRWLPPPAQDRFRLAYRSGNEEVSCSVDLELDAAAGHIIELTPSGC